MTLQGRGTQTFNIWPQWWISMELVGAFLGCKRE